MTVDWHRIAKLSGLLGSAGDGEVLNAARAIDKALKAQGLTWGDFKARLEGGAAYRPTGRPEPRQGPSRPPPGPDWEDKMREEEEKARQRQSRRRKGREW